MAQDVVILAILAVAILANVLLLASIPFWSRVARRSSSRDETSAPPVRRSARGELRDGPRDDRDARSVAAIEAFVADVPADAGGRTPTPTPSEVLSRRREMVAGLSPPGAGGPPRASTRQRERHDPAASSVTAVAARGHAPPISVLPGVADRAAWHRIVQEESARAARFERPVTVVIAELQRLEDVAIRLGPAAADRLVVETARLLVTEGRAVDQVARLDRARFGVLLPDTAESGARDYVDRVRAAADDWLRASGLSVRLSLGWASPGDDHDLVAAAAPAEERMREAGPQSMTGAPAKS